MKYEHNATGVIVESALELDSAWFTPCGETPVKKETAPKQKTTARK